MCRKEKVTASQASNVSEQDPEFGVIINNGNQLNSRKLTLHLINVGEINAHKN